MFVPENPELQQKRRCVRAVYEKLVSDGNPEGSETLSRAFAICTSSLREKGFLDRSGQPTRAGRQASMRKLAEPGARRKHREYEQILSSAKRDRKARRTMTQAEALEILASLSGAANRSFLPLPGSANKTLCKALAPLRDSMDEVFRCDTAFGTCRVDEGKASAGHCMLSAMIVQDLFGGKIQFGIVQDTPHYWTRVGNRDVDLTGDQFDEAKIRVRSKLYGGGSTFIRDPHEQLVQPMNAELTKMHERFVTRLIPILTRRGHEDWAGQLQRGQENRGAA